MNDIDIIPHCNKCVDRMLQPDLLNSYFNAVEGCKKLTKKEWTKGFHNNSNSNGLKYQHNCPLFKTDTCKPLPMDLKV